MTYVVHVRLLGGAVGSQAPEIRCRLCNNLTTSNLLQFQSSHHGPESLAYLRLYL